jgi:ankyrin repeat protein
MKTRTALLTFFLILVGLAGRAPGETPGQDAFDLLRKGDVQAVKALIEKSPQLVEAKDGTGMTLLHYAAYGKDVEFVNFLIDKGAKLEAQDGQEKTPLQIAVMNDRTEVAAALLKRGASLEAKDDYQRTALILCARERGQAATGRILIEAGADLNAADKFGDTALSLAAWRGKADFIDLLLAKGAKLPTGRGAGQMLVQAASQGLTNLFRRLVESGLDLKAIAEAVPSLLSDAAAGGSAEIVSALLDLGREPAKADRFGWTPLHYAARDGRTEVARALIGRGVPLDVRTVMGQTAYNVAVDREMDAVAALLKEKGADTSAMRFPELKGDYLGQTPPGDKPELFGPGIISSVFGLHSTAVFSPDGNEVVWHEMTLFPGEGYSRGGLLHMKRLNGRWTPPALMSFSSTELGDDQPFFTRDGQRLYFISGRPLPGESGRQKERIWCVDRTGDGWSEPRPLDPVVNDHLMHWQFSLDLKGNLYFAGQGPDSIGRQDIYLAGFVDGKYGKPVSLGAPVCTPDIEDTPFIAPDGSYLLFSHKFDLWVSFRDADGAWAAPLNLGPEVNSESIDLCPVVTADGKYLFFLSQRDGESSAYWIKADVIERLRPAAGKEAAALRGSH